jgi:Glu-tRNA(Gln) amidotransferase subunit E-like FAD-binding protein
MTQSEHNVDLLRQLRSTIASFVNGEIDLDGIQAALQSAMTLLENDAADAARAVRLAEADVEEIRHTRLLAEQTSAVRQRVEELLAVLPG